VNADRAERDRFLVLITFIARHRPPCTQRPFRATPVAASVYVSVGQKYRETCDCAIHAPHVRGAQCMISARLSDSDGIMQ